MHDDAASEDAPHPLREGLRRTRRSPPGAIVIFGAAGDLARRKLVPALFALQQDDLLDDRTLIVGVSRREQTDASFREHLRTGVAEFGRIAPEEASWARFARRVVHVRIADDAPAEYAALAERLAAHERTLDVPPEKTERVVYLSTPPSAFAPLARRLHEAGVLAAAGEGRARLVVEKPFGHDLRSARALNAELRALLPEHAIYRIDHYLGKETVQNLLVLRFANGLFEPLWNNRYVDHVQLTVAESIGVAGRGGYFEEAGIVRDMVQNHMFQFLALTAMEPPAAFEAGAVRDEKVKVLRALREVDPARIAETCVRGQYVRGSPGGKEIPGYLEEAGVAPGSRVETYAAMELRIDNWRWAGVPFFLRVGKGLPKRVSEIAVHFRGAPLRLFGGAGAAEPNVLVMRIQPDEGMSLRFLTKTPGPEMLPHPVTMDFRYGTSFGAAPPEAYERLLLDALLGDSTLFTRDDEVDASWEWITALRDAWIDSPVAVPEPYEAGTWGPPSADALLARSGRRWRRP
jgi:glucose-6-phosphate 1-dehydrogenase